MRLVFLPLALLALVAPPSSASNAPWSDPALLEADTWHGPQLRINGGIPGRYLVGSTIVGKSVMTGADSFFPASLPSTLKVPHLVPDSTHPDLAFWYTPDALERDNIGDGARVAEWPNIANICHDKHDERVRTAPLGTNFNDLCTRAKVANAQAVRGGNNVYVAKLGQAAVLSQPIYKKRIVNGHGVVRFTRRDAYGSSGQFLEMTQRCTDYTCATASSLPGWGADTTLGFGGTSKGITAFMVVRTAQSTSDVNPMGILHFNENGINKQGAAIYATETLCITDHYGVFPTGPQDSTTAPFLYFDAPGAGSNPAGSPAPSTQAGKYNNMQLKIYAGAADGETGIQPLSNVCTISQYLISSFTTVAVSAGATTVTVKGGAGVMSSVTLDNSMFLRIGGTATDATGAETLAITGAGVANGANTDIPIAATTGAFPRGALVHLCRSASMCTLFTATCNNWNPATNGLGALSTAIASGPFEIRNAARPTGAPTCPEGKVRQFSTYTGYINSDGKDDNGDNGCSTECGENGGCSVRRGDYGAGNTCLAKQGTARTMHDTNQGFKVLAVQISADRTAMNAYVNGFHEGCDLTAGIDGCAGGKITPPVKVSGATAQAYALLKIGALAAAGGAPNANFASMDVGEVLLYQESLTPEEMDRIGQYLADKFGINNYVVNDDVRSPYRTRASDRSAGACGSSSRVVHDSNVCKGQGSACAHDDTGTGTNGKLRHNVVLLGTNDADLSDGYYRLMRLTITGGPRATAAVVPATGQSCVVTAYTASGALATCDLTRSYEFSYVAYGTEPTADYWNRQGTNAVETNSTALFVQWVPADRKPPFVALLGDMGTPGAIGGAAREAVWVTAVEAQSSGLHKLTVTRAVGGTTAKVVANTDSLAKAAAARLNYPRAVVLSSAAASNQWLVVTDLSGYVTLPTSVGTITNWYARVSQPVSGGHEVVQVTQANEAKFVVITATVAVGAPASFDLQEVSSDYRYDFALLPGDKIRFGTAATGEKVTLIAGNSVSAGVGGVAQWTGLTANVVTGGWGVGTVVTLLERNSAPSPTAIKIVRAREGTSAPATMDHTLGTPIDFMYLPNARSSYTLSDCDTEAAPFSVGAPITTSRSGSKLVVEGWDLFPVDRSIIWALNAAVDNQDKLRLQNYLRVTVGRAPAVCRDPTIRTPECVTATADRGENELERCQIEEAGAGHCANDWTQECHCVNAPCAECASNARCNVYTTYPASVAEYYATRHSFAPAKIPRISCVVPSGLQRARLDSQDLNIYWHGVKTRSVIETRRAQEEEGGGEEDWEEEWEEESRRAEEEEEEEEAAEEYDR